MFWLWCGGTHCEDLSRARGAGLRLARGGGASETPAAPPVVAGRDRITAELGSTAVVTPTEERAVAGPSAVFGGANRAQRCAGLPCLTLRTERKGLVRKI